MDMGTFTYGVADRDMTADQASTKFFTDQSDKRIPLFKELNFVAKSTLRTGSLLIIPVKPDFNQKLKEKVQGIGQNLQGGVQVISGRSAQFMNDNAGTFDLIHKLGQSSAVQSTEKVLGHFEDRLKFITKDLKNLEELYKSELGKGLKTNTSSFFQKRFPIEKSLNEQLTGFARKHILHDHTQRNMRKALGIKHSATYDAYQAGGKHINVRGLSDSINASKGLAHFMKTASAPLTAIHVGSLGLDVVRTAQEDGYVAGGRKAFGNTGKFLGGKAGAKLGVAIAFGLATGGVGFGVMGIAAIAGGAVAGGYAGSKLGEQAGNRAFDGYHDVAKLGSELVDHWITKL